MLLDTPATACVCVKPPAPRPSKLPIVDGIDHVVAPGKPFALSEFGLVGVLPGLGAFWLMCGSAFHDDAHGAFMTLPPYTRTREGETRQLGEWSELPPGGPLSYEMLTEHG